MKISFVKTLTVVLLLTAVLCWFFWLRSQPMVKYRETNEMGKELITIDVCLDHGTDTKKTARILDDVWQRLRDIYYRMSNFIDDSDMGKINRSYQNPQRVGEDTVALFREAVRFKKLTHGVFDVTVRNLMDFWWKCQKENRLPSVKELDEAKKFIGLSHVKIISANTVEITNKGTRVDYGGIATGFAIDEVVKILRKRGIHNFLIDAGGDMYASGLNCSRKPWTIAVRNPEDKSKIMDIVQVSNASVSTSGNYEHYYSIQGHKFSHIINPMTGYPQKGVVSATVIATTALENDVLATSLCILNPKEGTALIDSLGKGYASIVVTKDQEGRLAVYKSKNYKNFEIKRRAR